MIFRIKTNIKQYPPKCNTNKLLSIRSREKLLIPRPTIRNPPLASQQHAHNPHDFAQAQEGANNINRFPILISVRFYLSEKVRTLKTN